MSYCLKINTTSFLLAQLHPTSALSSVVLLHIKLSIANLCSSLCQILAKCTNFSALKQIGGKNEQYMSRIQASICLILILSRFFHKLAYISKVSKVNQGRKSLSRSRCSKTQQNMKLKHQHISSKAQCSASLESIPAL